MHSRPLIAVIAVLCGVATGTWLLTRGSSTSGPRAAPSIDGVVRANDEHETAPQPLQTPEADMQPSSDAPAPSAAPDNQRAPAAPPPRVDFESKYKLRTDRELDMDMRSVSLNLALTQSDRLEALFAQFPELLAEGKYGARIIPKGAAFTTPAGYVSVCRTVKNKVGEEECRYLEFDPRSDPALADIAAERDWLRERLKVKKE